MVEVPPLLLPLPLPLPLLPPVVPEPPVVGVSPTLVQPDFCVSSDGQETVSQLTL